MKPVSEEIKHETKKKYEYYFKSYFSSLFIYNFYRCYTSNDKPNFLSTIHSQDIFKIEFLKILESLIFFHVGFHF